LLHRLELPLHPYLQNILRRLNGACRLDGILLTQLRQHLVEVEPQLRQTLLRDFDKDFFLLHAEQLDLADVRDPQQLLAHVVGKGFQLGVVETV